MHYQAYSIVKIVIVGGSHIRVYELRFKIQLILKINMRNQIDLLIKTFQSLVLKFLTHFIALTI